NNQNGLCIPYLLKLFPDACFVFVKRSPGDNINSLIEGWGKADEFATWSDEVPVDVNVENGKYKRWCFFLSNGWRNYVNSSVEEVCAFQYKSMNEEILKAKELVPTEQWFEIKYEDILINPVEGFRQAFDYFKLAFSTHLQAHCETVLSNPYNAFSEIKKDKWKEGRNRERIERVIPIVRDIAGRMGY
ncbi:MAG: sulfotransferase, partial [Gammaproteobacteria bacterium]|nr:sulfotransferase [Gammaproteobacteria bacterium]